MTIELRSLSKATLAGIPFGLATLLFANYLNIESPLKGILTGVVSGVVTVIMYRRITNYN